ncbi:MAG TPA: MOP flippase family protein [Thermodesulfobacteriota bacterium]|nr:MOP flippase family protein [Thermodesulfobacteriota bacterium]
MNLSQKIKSGTAWVSIAHFGSNILSLITTVILARLLLPKDFGIVAIAMVVWELVRLFGDVGIAAKLIYQQEDVDRYASAAFWLNILVALCLTLLTVLVSPLAASFYDNDMVKPILMLLALGFFLNSFGSIHSTLLTKELDFRKRSLVEIGVTTISKAITIAMAFAGYGVWSLVIPEVFSSPVRVLGFWMVCPWRPSLKFGLRYWKEIFGYGKYIFGSNLLRYLNINGDYMVIGKFLGAGELGLYTFAYNLADWPVKNIVWIVGRVAFPAFSKLQKDLGTMKEVFLKMTRLLSLVTFPLFIGLLAVANELIPVVFGEKWNRSIIPLQIIIGFTMIRSFVSPCGQIILALGRPDIDFKFNAVQVPLLLIAVLIGVSYGIIGVAIGMSLVVGLMGIVFLRLSIGLINLDLISILKVLFPALTSSLLMLFSVLALRYVLIDFGYKSYQVLLACVPFGGVMYFLALLTFFRGSFQMLWGMFMDVLGNRIAGIRKKGVSYYSSAP